MFYESGEYLEKRFKNKLNTLPEMLFRFAYLFHFHLSNHVAVVVVENVVAVVAVAAAAVVVVAVVVYFVVVVVEMRVRLSLDPLAPKVDTSSRSHPDLSLTDPAKPGLKKCRQT